MHRKGYITPTITQMQNFRNAFFGYSDGKHTKRKVMRFEADLDHQLELLLEAFRTCSYRTSAYIPKEVTYPKRRIVHKSQTRDHVIQWAAMLPVERWLMDSFYHRAPACVVGRGTHYFVAQERRELLACSQEEVYYFCQLDVHHYFRHIDHAIMKARIRTKIKDPILLHFLDEFIDSFGEGLVLGVKLSQLLSGLYLAPFDRLAIKCFHLADDPERMAYWRARYVTDCFCTCRTIGQAAELAKGVAYLNDKFDRYVADGLPHYSRFADNILIKHADKVFLRLMVELTIMTLARDYHLPINSDWAVRPTYTGIDVCGYVFHHEYTRLRKRNKRALCRQVAKLRKRGYTDDRIRLKCSSRAGFAYHCDSIHLLKTLHMERRLGSTIKNRKKKAPFDDMRVEQKMSLEDIVCHLNDDENDKLILLLDYKIEDSVIEKEDDGSPKQRIDIRYRLIDHVDNPDADDPTYIWRDEEHYSFSGSRVMIEQALEDFSKDDLPAPTVIKEFINKNRKKFYKFT